MIDLRDALLALVAPRVLGDELAPGARLTGASTELGLRLHVDAGSILVHIEIAPREEDPRAVVTTPRLAIAYRSGPGQREVAPVLGLALCRAVAALAAANEARVLGALAQAAASAREHDEAGARVREVRVDRALEPAESTGRPHYTLTPYVGCLVGCRFCYAQSRVATVRRLEGAAVAPWGSYVDARVNLPDALARELATLPPAPIKFCPIVSDPYQAIERRLGLTRACLETIARAPAGWVALVLTRTTLVERDAALLASLPGAQVGMSIPTADDDVRRHFEPRAASIADRLAILGRLRAAGVRTFAVVQPLLPGSIEALADGLAACVDSVAISTLGSEEAAKADFDDPRYAVARTPAWQRTQAEALAAALATRGVSRWDGELPPALA